MFSGRSLSIMWTTYLFDLGAERIEINKQVNSYHNQPLSRWRARSILTCICQRSHTTLVVRAGIHVVHANRIGAQFRHASNIPLALGRIDKWVTWGKLISNTCGMVSQVLGNAMRGLPLM